VLRQGADLVCFSGDKLLGGPQAGVIAGKREHVAALKKDPFFRALRCDKLILSALQATVDLHLGGGAGIPILEMMRLSSEGLRGRAQGLVEALSGAPIKSSVGEGESQIGGGSLPRTVIRSVTLDLLPQGATLETLAARLRTPPADVWPVVGYVSGDRFKLDLRTILPHQDGLVVAAIGAAAAS
jgi:L-seryl-tRNA(Ser) seleniumtransferase